MKRQVTKERTSITEETREIILKLYKEGKTYRGICADLKITMHHVRWTIVNSRRRY